MNKEGETTAQTEGYVSRLRRDIQYIRTLAKQNIDRQNK